MTGSGPTCALPSGRCREQEFDAAENMSELEMSFKFWFKWISNGKLYIHCLALNWCAQGSNTCGLRSLPSPELVCTRVQYMWSTFIA